MSNDHQNKNPNIPINPYNGSDLVKNLTDLSQDLSVYGIVFEETCSVLEDRIEEMFDNLGMKELSRIMIYPIQSRSNGLEDIKCYAYFDTEMQGAVNIVRVGGKQNKGNRNNGEKMTVYNLMPQYTAKGRYETNEAFKEVFYPLAMDLPNNEIQLDEGKDPAIAILELDFNAVMALYLKIGENAPYNFRIIDVVSTGKVRNGRYDDANIVIMKYIDTSRLARKNKKKGGRIRNWRELENQTIDKINRQRR